MMNRYGNRLAEVYEKKKKKLRKRKIRLTNILREQSEEKKEQSLDDRKYQ